MLCTHNGCNEPTTPVIFESDLVYSRMSNPCFKPYHILILPKNHRERFRECIPTERREMDDLTGAIIDLYETKFSFSDFAIWENDGINRSVSHYHRHVIPNIGQEPYPIKINKFTNLTEKEITNYTKEIKKIL